MINEISVKPKPQNKNAKIACLASLALSAIFVITYFIIPNYKGVIGVVAIGFLTVAILLYTKYIAVTFYYDITFDSEETPIFVVRRSAGRRMETLARVDLADIYEAKRETKEERKKHQTPRGVLKYNYCPTMMPPSSARLIVQGRYEKAEINIEASDEFLALILSSAEEARAMRAAALDDDY